MEKHFTITKQTKIILLAVLLVASLIFSVFASKVTFHERTIGYLTEKEENVLALTTTAAIVSTVISLLPDDSGTPIANQISDLTKWFLVILAAVFLEKYLVAIIFTVAFRYLIPLACAVLIAGLLLDKDRFRKTALKAIVAAVALSLVIPASVGVSRMIEETFHLPETIAEVSEIAETEGLGDAIGGGESTAPEPEGNFFQKFWQKLSGTVSEATESIKESVGELKETIANIPELIESSFSRLVESIAIMLVTSCLIPILVVVFFIWIIKMQKP